MVEQVATDFEARGSDMASLIVKARRLARRLLGLPVRQPHLLAVFQKR